MSNFTQDDSPNWYRSVVMNLTSCCKKSFGNTKNGVLGTMLTMLLLFSVGLLHAQKGQTLQQRSTFYEVCKDDAPEGFTEEQVLAMAQAAFNCQKLEVSKSIEIYGDDCSWEAYHTFTVVGYEECENINDILKYYYTGGDVAAPELTGFIPPNVSNLNLCFAQAPAGPDASFIANQFTDNCGNVNVEKSTESTGDDCEWTITHTYTVVDDCGNAADNVVITYSGGDTAAPTLTGVIPTGETGVNACFAEKSEGPTEAEIAALFSDNCSEITADNVTKEANSKGTDCKWLAIYTYTVLDNCGNIYGPFDITYSGGDTEAPVLADAPADIEISCIDQLPAQESLSWTDNCSGEGSVMPVTDYSGFAQAGPQPCTGGVITRTWNYTDACNNVAEERVQTITILPAPEAEFEAVEDMTLSCSDADVYEAGTLAYSNGVQGACAIYGNAEPQVTENFDSCGGSIVINWSFADPCGREITATKTITVEPAPAAEFAAVEDMTITCAEADVYEASNLAYSNGLEGTCGINGEAEPVVTENFDYCGGQIDIDWTYTDNCGRTINAKKVITVQPAPEAEFDAVEDMTITCAEADVYEASNLAYSNGLDGTCGINGEAEPVVSENFDVCGGQIDIDWYFTDNCGRTINAKKVITVQPAPEAEFETPAGGELTCEEANNFVAPTLAYSNGLSGTCEISGSVEGYATPNYSVCGGTIEVVWSYTDSCERTIDASVTYTVSPAPEAQFEENQGEIILSCEEAEAFVAPSLGYTNNGTGVCLIEGEVEGTATPNYNACGGNIIVTWSYTDECERTITAEQLFKVSPAPQAEFATPEGGNLSCEEAEAFVAPSLAYTNNGTGNCEISGEVDGVATPSYDACGGNIVVDWTYEDICGRVSTASVTYTVDPAPTPEFSTPEGGELSCEEAVSFVTPSLGYTNNGTGSCLIEGEVAGVATPDYTYCGGTITVNWEYTDACDNTINASVVYTVLPAPEAQFETPVGGDLTCEEAESFVAPGLGYSNGGTSTCDISGVAEGVLVPSYDYCGGQIEVDYSFTDDCGRTITAKAYYNVSPAPEAEFDAVEDMTLSCADADVYEASNLAYSNGLDGTCGINGEAEPVVSENFDVCGGQIDIDWYFTDNCGRTINAKKVITVQPAPEATFDAVEDMTLSCADADLYEAGNLAYSNGLQGTCGINGEAEPMVTEDFDYCGGTIVINWSYTDACERTINATKTITVEPAPEAEFTAVEDMTITCAEADVYQASNLAYSNGLDGTCGINGEAEPVVTENFDVCGGQIDVDWTFTDNCGRTINAKKVITVQPAPEAEFETPYPLTISCEDLANFEADYLAYSNGLDGTCGINGEVQGTFTPFEGSCGEFEVDYSYTDECGRTINAKQTVTVEDNIAPVIDTEAMDMTVECDGSGNQAQLNAWLASYAGAAASDTCGNVTWSNDFGSLSDDCGATGSVTVIFTATDDCGNYSTTSATFTIEDTTAPTIDTQAMDMTVECDGEGNQADFDAWLASYGGAVASDDCGSVTWSSSCGLNDQGNGGNYENKLLADESEFSGSETFIDFEELGTSDVVLTNQYASSGVTFGNNTTLDHAPIFAAGTITPYSGTGVAKNWGLDANGYCPCDDFVMTFTNTQNRAGFYVATNPGSSTVTVTCLHNGTVVGTEVVQTGQSYSFFGVESTTGFDEIRISGPVNGAVAIEDLRFEGGGSQGQGECVLSDECGATGSATVTFTATDDCGNTSTTTATFTVEDTTAPTIDTDAMDMTVECDGEGNQEELANWLASYGGAAASDQCGDVTWSNDFEALSDDCGATGSATVIFTATDDCGNTSTTSATFTIEDTIAPTIDTEAMDMTVECDGEGNQQELTEWLTTYGGAAASDQCGDVTWSNDFEALSDDCGATGSATVIFTATDSCGNTSTTSATFTIEDTTAPTIDTEAMDMTVECDGEGNQEELANWLASYGGAAASDQCGDVTWSNDFTALSDDCGATGSATVIFTATDDCGNTSTTSATFTIEDTVAPELGEGNTNPVGESNLDLCMENRPEGPTEEEVAALYVDGCGTVVVTKTEKALGDNCAWSVMYSYTVADDCGNALDPFKVYYNGGDQSAPTLVDGYTLPEGQTDLQCKSEAPLAPKASDFNGYFEDNCSDVTIGAPVMEMTGDDCAWTVSYTFSVTDACGNEADPIVITHSGADTIAPELTGTVPVGENELNYCLGEAEAMAAEAQLPNQPTLEEVAALYSDNCTNPLTADNVSLVTKVYGDDCSWIIQLEYTVSDNCGNEASYIKVNYQGGDQSAPTQTGLCTDETMFFTTSQGFACPAEADFSLNVGDEVTANDNSWSIGGVVLSDIGQNGMTLQGCFEDNCTANTDLVFKVTGKSTPDLGGTDVCSTTMSITFDVYDNCGNVYNDFVCTWILSDDVAPVIECPTETVDLGPNPQLDENGIPVAVATTLAANDACQGAVDATYDANLDTVEEDIDTQVDFFEFKCFANGSLFATLQFQIIGFDSNGYAIYDEGVRPGVDTYTYILSFNYDNNRWEMTESGDLIFFENSTSTIPSCSAAAWGEDNVVCEYIELTCENQDGGVGTYTLTRTFTANDGCGNTSECAATYTWTINNQDASPAPDPNTNYGTSLPISAGNTQTAQANNMNEDGKAQELTFKAYPVPFDKEVTVSYDFDFDTEVSIELFDTKGILVRTFKADKHFGGNTSRTTLNLADMPSQMYYVKVTTNQGSVTKKILSKKGR